MLSNRMGAAQDPPPKLAKPGSRATAKSRDVVFVLLGVAGLMFRGHYTGLLEEYVQSYGGNIAVSFAVYFIAKPLSPQLRWKKVATACLALGAVELFEALDGFGVMANVYDPLDFAANAVGVALALIVDSV